MRRLLQATTALGLCALTATGAHAQTTTPTTAGTPSATSLQQVVVTAERRKSTVQKTAASISVRSGVDMTKQGRFTLSDYLEDIPGVSGVPTLTNAYDPYASIVIRGVVPSNGGSGVSPPTTAVYVDDVYQGLGGAYDVDRLEVLRGPQGTLYGRSATGGVIANYSNDPVLDKLEAAVTAAYGNYDTRNVQVMGNVPLGSEVALRVSGLEQDQLGYINFRDGSSEETAGRAKLLYQPNADLSVSLGFATQEDHRHTGGPSFVESGAGVLTPGSPTTVAPAEEHGHQFWGKMNWDFDIGTLTYIPSFRREYYQPTPVYFPNPPFLGPGNLGYNPSQTTMDQTITQELRVASNGDTQLSWIGGVFYYNNIYKNDSYLQWVASGAIAFDNVVRRRTQDLGVFGETTYKFTNTTRATIGLRYDLTPVTFSASDENNTNHSGALGSPTFFLPEVFSTIGISQPEGTDIFQNVTYKARIEHDLTPTNSIYALASSGFLPGDVQVASLPDGDLYSRRFAEENLNAFEVGSKNRFLDNRLQVNASAYYYLYQGYQSDATPQPNIPGSAHITITAPATMYGVDLDATYRLTPIDTVGLTFGAINARFTGNPFTNLGANASGYFDTFVYQKTITGIAPETFTARYDHTFDLADGSSIDAHADMQYSAGYYSGPLNLLELPTNFGDSIGNNLSALWIPSQVLGNFSATWTSANGKYSFGGFVRNVGNDIYVANQNELNGTWYGTPTQGRTYGATLHLSY